MTQTVKLTYFKDTGKFYGDGEFTVDASKEMFHIFEIVRNLQRRGRLPGMVDGATFAFILVNAPGHRNDHPALIVADNVVVK